MPEIVVIALGGNAIHRPGERGTLEEQLANVRRACAQIARVAARGHRLAIVHGNGPQVGHLLLQNEAASGLVPALPLDALVAQTQGLIGYMLQRELSRALAEAGAQRPVASVVTQVLVDTQDPAFADPTKPIGPFYDEAQARELERAGWTLREDAGRGWRRVVPSPVPLQILEVQAIRALLDAGVIVVACGGGGVPVARSGSALEGLPAVIDKDLAAQRLAGDVGASTLVILTDVPCIYLDYGKPRQRPLHRVTAGELAGYLRDGHFPPGSMRSKVEGAIAFLRAGGRRAVIAGLDDAFAAVEGSAGTQILAAAESEPAGDDAARSA